MLLVFNHNDNLITFNTSQQFFIRCSEIATTRGWPVYIDTADDNYTIHTYGTLAEARALWLRLTVALNLADDGEWIVITKDGQFSLVPRGTHDPVMAIKNLLA